MAKPAPKAGAPAAGTPHFAQDARAPMLRTFYTCQTATLPDFAEGTGWRLVGPLRQG